MPTLTALSTDDASQRKAALGSQAASNGINGTSENRQNAGERHQAVFSLDYETWEELVDVLGIEEPLIPDRTAQEQAATQVSAHGWYG